jgi:methylmalonyl-CoA/ethylmalonyl-CoA epimerase
VTIKSASNGANAGSHGPSGPGHAGGVAQIAQHAEDLDRATEFYTQTLGLPLIARFGPLVFVDLGGTRLLLEEVAPPSMIYLRVDDLESRIAALRRAGVEIVSEPHDIFTDTDGVFGGEWLVETQAFIRDSEGNLVGLVAHRS